MSARVILVVFIVFILAGCATNSQKQPKQSQAVVQELNSRDYVYEDTLLHDSYEKPAKQTYSEPTIQLSPKQIQMALKNAGFYLGPIDGKIGPKTKAAIIRFQKANGLKSDGIVGKRTSAQLNKYLPR